LSSREKVHTPRSLAAILNPDSPRGPDAADSRHDRTGAPRVADSASSPESASESGVHHDAIDIPNQARRTPGGLRERVRSESGQLELILFRAGAEVFALPLDSVREALDGAQSYLLPDMPRNVNAMLNVDGISIPICDGDEFLGVAITSERPAVLVIKGDPEDSALAVDSILSSCRVEAAEIRRVPALEDAKGVFVGVFFFAGELVALLDPAVFARRQNAARAEQEIET
jgi:chemotaxis signal transduction protein